MDTLRGVVEASLTKIGKESAEILVPELCAIDIPSSTALTTLLLDPMNTVLKEHALLDVFTYFQQAKELNIAHVTGTHQREMETRLNKAELRHISRHCSTGFVLTQLSNGISITVMDGPSAAHCDEPQSSYEFIPLVGFATGNHEGPIKAAMDDLFLSRMNRGRSRSTICTLFLGHLLHLWREVITLWTVGEVVSTRVDVPMEISQSPAPKGKKRARSPEDSSSTLHVSKRTSSTRSWGLNSEETSSQKSLYATSKTANAAPQPAAIRALIEAAPPVFSLPSTIEVDTSEQFVPRTFAAHFGSGASGSWCGWNPTRRLKSFRSGVGNNQILRASNNLQPFRPVEPCSSGILLELPGCNDYRRPSKDQEQDHHYTAFVQPGKTNWLYCGEYRLVDKGDITWAELPSWVQKKWVDQAFLRKEHDGLREILKTEVGANVSKNSMERAFENGHIKIRVLVMQCVDYHDDIQKAIVVMNKENPIDKDAASQHDTEPPEQEDTMW